MSKDNFAASLGAIASGRKLGRRLTRAALESAALALLVAGLAINLALYAWSSADLQNAAGMQARIAADGSGAALLFGDAKAAGETLATLKAVPEIIRVDLFDAAGQRFSTYERAPQAPTPWSTLLAGVTRAEAPVVQNGSPIGRIAVEVSLVPLRTRVAQLAALTLVTALFALAASYLRVRRVRRAVVRTEAHRDRLALFDSVTGLYNRHAATEHLRHLVETSQGAGRRFALLLMDLDDFKLVNDTLGHIAGDEVLKILGERLRAGLGTAAPVFRLGGDEFVAVLSQQVDDAALQGFGREALACLRDPLLVSGHEVFVRGSVGVAR